MRERFSTGRCWSFLAGMSSQARSMQRERKGTYSSANVSGNPHSSCDGRRDDGARCRIPGQVRDPSLEMETRRSRCWDSAFPPVVWATPSSRISPAGGQSPGDHTLRCQSSVLTMGLQRIFHCLHIISGALSDDLLHATHSLQW